MKKLDPRFSLLVAAAICALVGEVSAQSPSSVYSTLDAKKCRTVSVEQETGASRQVCAGVAGFRLQVEDDDARMSVTVIDPKGSKHELRYWHVVTSSFSSLGDKAEWRVVKRRGRLTPVALIVRVNASEDPENSGKITSYLAVAKITPQKTCVTDKIKPGATQNAEARRAADASATRPCLEP